MAFSAWKNAKYDDMPHDSCRLSHEGVGLRDLNYDALFSAVKHIPTPERCHLPSGRGLLPLPRSVPHSMNFSGASDHSLVAFRYCCWTMVCGNVEEQRYQHLYWREVQQCAGKRSAWGLTRWLPLRGHDGSEHGGAAELNEER
jgi:hypothetical protein